MTCAVKIPMDNQPISASFFGEGTWLNDFITPQALEVQKLYKKLTQDLSDVTEIVAACHRWVAGQVKYVKFVRGKIWIEGKSSEQSDLWSLPSITAKIQVGNCANKAFLLTSLLRNAMPTSDVHCVLGNLYNGIGGGHAWTEISIDNVSFVVESTQPSAPPLISCIQATRYEPVHYFNDRELFTVPGKTVMTPMTACYSQWLKSYLDWAYIESVKEESHSRL